MLSEFHFGALEGFLDVYQRFLNEKISNGGQALQKKQLTYHYQGFFAVPAALGILSIF